MQKLRLDKLKSFPKGPLLGCTLTGIQIHFWIMTKPILLNTVFLSLAKWNPLQDQEPFYNLKSNSHELQILIFVLDFLEL